MSATMVNVVKMRLLSMAISRANREQLASLGAVQRTDPTKSDVSDDSKGWTTG